MKKTAKLALMALGALGLCGCVAVLVGGGVAGGMAISQDTVELNLDKSYNTVWSVSVQEIKKMNGAINLQDKEAGKIEANVQDSNVEVTLNQITPKTVQLHVKARKNLFPNVDLANALSGRIANRL